jgi:CubicO group peptidase (beta-lactamase class C family)
VPSPLKAIAPLVPCFFSFLFVGQARSQPPIQAIDQVFADALKAWEVPGAALGIVQNGKLIYLKGMGVAELGKKQPVTPDAIFPIASCTKSFTTLAMAMLVDEGKMGWDDPVRRHVEFFHLADPLADANVTLRDLVTHRTGLGRHELLWYRSPWSLSERLRKISRVKPEYSFRSMFQYQSIVIGAAGMAVGRASNSNWADFVQERILVPLEMKATSFTTVQVLRNSMHASPHRRRGGKTEVLSWYKIDEPDPAGSINATARDLVKFIQFQLGDGTWKGTRLVSAANLAEMHSPQMIIRIDPYVRLMNPFTHQASYGLGWIIQDYRGRHLWMHGGSIDGFRAHFTLVPEARLGFVLLNNLDHTQMNLAVSNTLVDLFLGLDYKDWNAYYLEVQHEEEKTAREHAQKLRASRIPKTHPTLPLAAYAGTYVDAAYGTGRVTLEKKHLVLRWSTFTWPLEHFHYDTFLINDDVVTDGPVLFTLSAEGHVASMRALGRTFRRIQTKDGKRKD